MRARSQNVSLRKIHFKPRRFIEVRRLQTRAAYSDIAADYDEVTSGRTFYMQQRYYDPIAARFLSLDPAVTDANTGRSFNRYSYANNNTFKYIDPDGREVKDREEMWRVYHPDDWASKIAEEMRSALPQFNVDGDAGSPESDNQGLADTIGDQFGIKIIRAVPGVDLVGCLAAGCRAVDYSIAAVAVSPVGFAARGTGLAIRELRGVLSAWSPASFPSAAASIRYHYARHGSGQGLKQFTREAMEFFSVNSSLATPHLLRSGEVGSKIRTSTHFGIYDTSGKIVTYGPR